MVRLQLKSEIMKQSNTISNYIYLWILPALILLVSPAGAQTDDNPFNVDCRIGWGGCYRPEQWTPVDIGITARIAEPFDGVLRLAARQDELTNMTIVRPFVLTPDLPLNIPLSLKLSQSADRCNLELYDQSSGRIVWRHNYSIYDYSNLAELVLTQLQPSEMLIGHIGRHSANVLQIPTYSVCQTDMGTGTVYVKSRLPRLAPWDWTGYQSLDCLILYDPDWSEMRQQQSQAILDWVQRGGRLLLVLGSNPIPTDNPIRQALPFAIESPITAEVNSTTLRRWTPGSPEPAVAAPQAVHAWQLSIRDNSIAYNAVFDQSLQQPLAGTTQLGLGFVTVVAFDPANLTLTPQQYCDFWITHLETLTSRTHAPLPSTPHINIQQSFGYYNATPSFDDTRAITFTINPEPRESETYYRYMPTVAQGSLNSILSHLLTIPELRPLSIGWVILLLSILALLLGPVDYFVLKKLDRQPLTWITTTVCIAMFTVTAYYGVYALRSGKLQQRVVSVVDQVQGLPQAYQTIYTGIYSPRSQAYPIADPQPAQWFSSIAPVAMNYGLGMRSSSPSTRNLNYIQRDGANTPQTIPISIWSMQCLLTESTIDPLPIQATVQRTDFDTYDITIANNSDLPISRAYLRLPDNRAILLDPIDPLTTRQWHATTQNADNTTFTPFSINSNLNSIYHACGTLERTKNIEHLLEIGAAVVYLETQPETAPFNITGRDADINHVQFIRLVVFPTERR